MFRKILIILLFLSVSLYVGIPVFSADDSLSTIRVTLVDQRDEMRQHEIDAFVYEGMTFIPLTKLCLFYGISIKYNPETKEVTLNKYEKEVVLKSGSRKVYVNGDKKTVDIEPKIIKNKISMHASVLADFILKELLYFHSTWRLSSRKLTVNDEAPVTFAEDNFPTATEAGQKKEKKKGVIAEGDILQISVWQLGAMEFDELTREREVIDGTINLPFVGEMPVEGMTAGELEDMLAKRLKPFIKNPEVQVKIKAAEQKSYTVQVFGAVMKPGLYKFDDYGTLMEAINKAGGFNDYAKMNKVRVTRYIHHSPYVTEEVDCKEILYEGQRQNDIPLQPKDIIFVPKKKSIFGHGFSTQIFQQAMITAVTIIVGMMVTGNLGN